MNSLTRISGIALAALIGVFATQTTAQAQIGPDPHSKARHSRIVGLWDVDVDITNCSGTTLFSFHAMHKYEQGGTGQVVPATNPGALSAHMLVWNYAGFDQYQTAMKMFRFNGGAYDGWVEVVSEVSMNDYADEYEGRGEAKFYDKDGNFQSNLTTCPVFSGTRFTG